jgi:membrane associated rhomboid family serine protease
MLPAFGFGLIMTGVKLAEFLSNSSFSYLGLRPREWKGLFGILFFPFLHGSGAHLASNIFPFIFLSILVYNLTPEKFWKIYGFTFFLSGFWTWCFARPGIVVGASAWVYALLGFLWIAGFMRLGRKTMIIAGGLAFLYGGMVQGLLPVKAHISWEGHLMGLVSGALAAWYWRKDLRLAETPKVFKSTHAEEEPPYPYWLYPFPHVVDAHKRVLDPNDLVWENGKPRLKTEEELNPNPPQETPETDPNASQARKTGFSDGRWTWNIS